MTVPGSCAIHVYNASWMIIIHHPGAACIDTIKGAHLKPVFKRCVPLGQSCFSRCTLCFAFIFAFSWSDQNLRMRGQVIVSFLVLVSLLHRGMSTDIQIQQLQVIVEKLQNTVLSISKENAKYKKLLEDLVERLPDFENVENCI